MVHDVNYHTDPHELQLSECGTASVDALPCGALPAGFQQEDFPVGHEVFLHLMAIGEGLRQHIAAVAARFDFTPQQALLVERLAVPRTMGQIAAALDCDKSNVTGMISRLETRGLVIRTTDEHDRRIKWLTLTDDGRLVRARLRAGMMTGQVMLAGFADEERDAFLGFLRRAGAGLAAPHSNLTCAGAAQAGIADGGQAIDSAGVLCHADNALDCGTPGS